MTERDGCRVWNMKWRRRRMVGGGLALAAGLVTGLAPGARAEDPSEMPPQPGDRLVFLTGPKKGTAIKPDDLPLGGPQVQAYPASPEGVLREGSRLNLLIVARFDPAQLAPETRARATDGVVAYSGVCTHQACPVNAWSDEQKMAVCSCHGSTYDLRDGAKLVFGPAPHALAALPLKRADDVLVVADKFTRHVGGEMM